MADSTIDGSFECPTCRGIVGAASGAGETMAVCRDCGHVLGTWASAQAMAQASIKKQLLAMAKARIGTSIKAANRKMRR
ncbi:hypothetical protein [Phyllobacterium zundukense]|uniref:Uncharacterized protein n=1 Tax=Phyllobacterium zundukense TaxID=1867719 RepID=A0ACD4CY09_9HYPH|nr:hypothetical protein [Phyllobacterium zundukense]UXN58508.1 hypothetical protein N8E88_10815 [Phyllobacterium zundukense]